MEIAFIYNFADFINDNKLQYYALILNIVEILYIVNSKKLKDSFKITWMIVFVLMPGFGAILYIILEFTNIFNVNRAKLKNAVLQSKNYYNFSFSKNFEEKYYSDELKNNAPNDNLKRELANEFSFYNYYNNSAGIPLYQNNNFVYFDNGKEAFEDIIPTLSKAKKFIFIEIFILSDGIVWQEILEVLKRKAKEGVKVRVLVDGLNSVSFFNRRYCKYLASFGIDAKIFKPISPFLTNTQNHRDHRKIFVIDNVVAYTGGINIADEYANLYKRFGRWKDTGIKIEGSAVQSMTIMFLQLWQLVTKSKISDIAEFISKNESLVTNAVDYTICVPYTDYPSLSENISLQFYRYMFNTAKKYMYIMTPYLVIDEAMVDSIEAMAKRGVDVKIIVPRIPDKKYVFYVNRSYYRSLTLAGAKVYEYVPGFVHSKLYMQDDMRAVVGTANLDYRSLYLHYENGIYMYGNNEVLSNIKADFIRTLEECDEMTLKDILKIPVSQRFLGAVLKMFAPLM